MHMQINEITIARGLVTKTFSGKVALYLPNNGGYLSLKLPDEVVAQILALCEPYERLITVDLGEVAPGEKPKIHDTPGT